MLLSEALRLDAPAAPRVVSFVGAGGKTSGLFLAARQAGKPTALTTTTHFSEAQAALADHHIILDSPRNLPSVLPDGVTLFSGGPTVEGRLKAPPPGVLEALAGLVHRTGGLLLVEADGSRRLPLKAPAAHEPVIPSFCSLVVVTVGLSGLGQPLDERTVHRPEVFSRLSGIAPGSLVTMPGLCRVLGHPEGGLKGVLPGVPACVLFNQADTPTLQAMVYQAVPELLSSYRSVIAASLQNQVVYALHEKTAGVVLAAGGANRMGGIAKPLLEWHGRPLIWHVVQAGLQAGLDQMVVVSGAHHEQISAALQPLGSSKVRVVQNPGWMDGQSTSVRVGVQALGEEIGAAVFLLSDQPQTPPGLVRGLVEMHAQTRAPLIAPLIDGQRGNPVLFDRFLFRDLCQLTGDTGGRALFSRYKAAWLTWHDRRAGLDVDTPEDYQKLITEN